MTVNDQMIQKIRDYAMCDMTPLQIASLLNILPAGLDTFIDAFLQPETLIAQAYKKGRNMMDYNTNVELARAAEKGDVEAIEMLAHRKEEQKYNEALAEMWGI